MLAHELNKLGTAERRCAESSARTTAKINEEGTKRREKRKGRERKKEVQQPIVDAKA